MREKKGGIDGRNFYARTETFVELVRVFTFGGRKVLLVFDRYRAHLSLKVLSLFERNWIIAYALPEHTPEKTQGRDVVLCGEYGIKSALACKEILGSEVTVSHSGFIDTTNDAILTSAAVLAAVTEKSCLNIARKKSQRVYCFTTSTC